VATVLSEYQQDVSTAFATTGGDKFAGFTWHKAANGAPVLDGAAAWIECEVARVVPAGDHLFVLARVVNLALAAVPRPLVFFQGRYAQLDHRARHACAS
jgi:3-hydroxy-9,10-secoandrosta-1,3,5(10)-triene-9,17-dione monooxygenase reductase component